MKKFSFIILLAVSLLASCTIKVSDKDSKEKNEVTKTYDLSGFKGIAIVGSSDVEFVQDSVYKVEVIGSETSLKGLKLEVKDSILRIAKESYYYKTNQKKFIFNNRKYTVRISSPYLTSIEIAGSGDFESKKPLKTDNFVAYIAGSGNIEFNTITAKSVQVNIAGSGNVDLKEKYVDNTILNIEKNGNIDVYFDKCNVVTTSTLGSGNITLKGDIKNLQNTNGDTDISELKIKK